MFARVFTRYLESRWSVRERFLPYLIDVVKFESLDYLSKAFINEVTLKGQFKNKIQVSTIIMQQTDTQRR